jgi:hypothetical protein
MGGRPGRLAVKVTAAGLRAAAIQASGLIGKLTSATSRVPSRCSRRMRPRVIVLAPAGASTARICRWVAARQWITDALARLDDVIRKIRDHLFGSWRSGGAVGSP